MHISSIIHLVPIMFTVHFQLKNTKRIIPEKISKYSLIHYLQISLKKDAVCEMLREN